MVREKNPVIIIIKIYRRLKSLQRVLGNLLVSLGALI